MAAIAVLLAVPAAAWGYPVYSRYYRVKYRDQGGCNVCHNEGGGTRRNAYGEDWQRSGEGPDAFALIERRDSDGDGTGNLDEIRGGSNPGDSSSTLVNPGHKWRLRHHVPIPVEQMRHALGAATDYTYRELDIGAEQAKQLEGIAGRPLRFEERHPTLYYALNGAHRTGAKAIFLYPQLPNDRAVLLVGVPRSGKSRKLFLLRAEKHDLRLFRPYLECLEKVADLTSATETAACKPTAGQQPMATEIIKALRLALATIAAFPS